MNDKFRLLENDTIELWGRTLYRIESLKDFYGVSKGEKGGYIEKERNLAVYGNAWISGDARVTDNAIVFGNAYVTGNAHIRDNARVDGNASVYDNAYICDNACVSGNASVSGDARVDGDVLMFGNALVSGDARLTGESCLAGEAYVTDSSDLLVIGPIGSEDGHLTAFKDKNRNISVNRGCFNGTLEKFEKAVNRTHGDNKHGKMYRIAIELIKVKLGGSDDGN